MFKAVILNRFPKINWITRHRAQPFTIMTLNQPVLPLERNVYHFQYLLPGLDIRSLDPQVASISMEKLPGHAIHNATSMHVFDHHSSRIHQTQHSGEVRELCNTYTACMMYTNVKTFISKGVSNQGECLRHVAFAIQQQWYTNGLIPQTSWFTVYMTLFIEQNYIKYDTDNSFRCKQKRLVWQPSATGHT